MISDKTLEILHKYICEQAIAISPSIQKNSKKILEKRSFKQRLNTCLKRGYKNAVLHRRDAEKITDKDILQEAKEEVRNRINNMHAYRGQHPTENKMTKSAFNNYLLANNCILNAIELTLVQLEIEDGKDK